MSRKDSEMIAKEQGVAPKLSVIVPVYRTPEDLLRGEIESILASEGVDLELICVDDYPGSESSKVLEEYRNRDPRVVLLVNDRNRGVSYSRNRGLAVARGEWVAFQDSDDTITPTGFADLIAFAKKNNLSMAHGLMRYPDQDKVLTAYGVPPGEARVVDPTGNCPEGINALLEWISWSVVASVYRRTAFDAFSFNNLLYRYEDSMAIAQLILAQKLRFGCLNQHLYTVFPHTGSLSRRTPTARNYVEYAIAARAIARLMEQGKETIAPKILRFYAWRCLHILFSDRRGHNSPLTRRQRRAFCVGARDTCRVLHPHLPARLRLPLFLLITAPRLLFMPGNLLWNAIKWGMIH